VSHYNLLEQGFPCETLDFKDTYQLIIIISSILIV
jgi:hypothetical protein